MLSVNWSDGAIRPTPVLFGSRTVFFTSTPVIPSANAMPSIPPPTKTASTSDGVEVVTTGAAIPITTHPEFHLRLFSPSGLERTIQSGLLLCRELNPVPCQPPQWSFTLYFL